MRGARTPIGMTALLVLLAAAIAVSGEAPAPAKPEPWQPEIPEVWDPEGLETLMVPFADAEVKLEFLPPEEYAKFKPRPLYKSYPVYALDREPPGYMEWLAQQEPAIVFDPSELETREDWIRAGERVFDAPHSWDEAKYLLPDLRDPAWWEHVDPPLAADGSMPFFHYVIRTKGKVEVGFLSCAGCHTRVMPDGSVIKGAQGNLPWDRAVAYGARAGLLPLPVLRKFQYHLYAAPWLDDDPSKAILEMDQEEIAARHDAVPPGVMARQGASLDYPVQVPDLIGVAERRYFDRTGLMRQRGVVDLMRYATLNQDLDTHLSFGGFTPLAFFSGKRPPSERYFKYTKEALYALGLYLYSLEPPPNPNPFDELAAHGKQVFEAEGCPGCHVPPLYTSNKLTPAAGFEVPQEHFERFNILPLSVGTDPGLATRTRRGTGYYKVPSLKGVWYRGPLEHSGSVATLEDWFDSRRTSPDYVPTGFRGYGVEKRAIPGHPFGLHLSSDDKKALIAFLRTL